MWVATLLNWSPWTTLPDGTSLFKIAVMPLKLADMPSKVGFNASITVKAIFSDAEVLDFFFWFWFVSLKFFVNLPLWFLSSTVTSNSSSSSTSVRHLIPWSIMKE